MTAEPAPSSEMLKGAKLFVLARPAQVSPYSREHLERAARASVVEHQGTIIEDATASALENHQAAVVEAERLRVFEVATDLEERAWKSYLRADPNEALRHLTRAEQVLREAPDLIGVNEFLAEILIAEGCVSVFLGHEEAAKKYFLAAWMQDFGLRTDLKWIRDAELPILLSVRPSKLSQQPDSHSPHKVFNAEDLHATMFYAEADLGWFLASMYFEAKPVIVAQLCRPHTEALRCSRLGMVRKWDELSDLLATQHEELNDSRQQVRLSLFDDDRFRHPEPVPAPRPKNGAWWRSPWLWSGAALVAASSVTTWLLIKGEDNGDTNVILPPCEFGGVCEQ